MHGQVFVINCADTGAENLHILCYSKGILQILCPIFLSNIFKLSHYNSPFSHCQIKLSIVNSDFENLMSTAKIGMLIFRLKLSVTIILTFKGGRSTCTVKPHYNTPHYKAVFNTTRPCHGSKNDYVAIMSIVNNLIITRFTYNTVCFYGPQR